MHITSAATRAAEITPASCSWADVQDAVDAAASGDLVRVPAGEAVWEQMLLISKGVRLIGAGRGWTVVRMGFNQVNGYACTHEMNFLIKYAPAVPSRRETLQISGFTFDLDGRGQWASLGGEDIENIDTVIISENTIKNGGSRTLSFCDTFYGVVYNNIFDSLDMGITTYGFNAAAWEQMTYAFGSAETIFYEDNTFIRQKEVFQDSGVGGRFVSRFNEYLTDGLGGLFPAIDAHGNQGPGSNEAIMAFEIYGNVITNTYPNSGSVLSEQRGGKAMVWGNQINVANASTSGAPQIWEEYADSTSSVPTGPEGQPQHVSDSYYWQNFNNKNGKTLIHAYVPNYGHGTATGGGANYLEDLSGAMSPCVNSCQRRGIMILSGTGAGQLRTIQSMTTSRAYVNSDWDIVPDSTSVYNIEFDCCNAVAENSEYWNEHPGFDGTVGIGVGPLAERPASCTPGVAYWATDEGEWNAKHPGPDGRLYRCAAPDTWELYYTPYAYPHPLRANAIAVGSTAPESVNLQGRNALPFPNPATSHVRFLMHLSQAGEVMIDVYNIQGERVASLRENRPAGRGQIMTWDCQDAAPGFYFASVHISGQGSDTYKIALQAR